MGGIPYDWRNNALCRNLNTTIADNLFFPERGEKSNKAKAFCRNCPVIAECLENALKFATDGFQAGTTERERNEMRAFLETVPDRSMDKYLPKTLSALKARGSRVRKPAPKTNPTHKSIDDLNGPDTFEEQQMSLNLELA